MLTAQSVRRASLHVFAALLTRARTTPNAVFCHLLRGGEAQIITVAEICAEAGNIALQYHRLDREDVSESDSKFG